MAYEFQKDKIAKFQFAPNFGQNKTTIDGINSTLTSATTICDGVTSLMAIGSNSPYFDDGQSNRTVKEYVNYTD